MSLQPMWEMLDSQAVPPQAVPWLLLAIALLLLLILCTGGER